jgi:hypothetical protein
MFGRREPPRREDLALLTETIHRLRVATLVCFSLSVLIYALVSAMPASAETLNRVAALGTAWWVVGFLMMLGSVYFASRRAMLHDDE